MKKIIYGLLILFSSKTFAQQDGEQHYSQFMFNRITLNPAQAGLSGVPTLGVFYRYQWAGPDLGKAAPVNQLLTFNMPMKQERFKNIGLGGLLLNERIGFERKLSFSTFYAYHIKTSTELNATTYSLGLTAGIRQFSIDQSYDAKTKDDDVLYGSNRAALIPNFGFGFNYTKKNLYGGLSITNLGQPSIKYTAAMNKAKMRHHYYLSTGYNYELDPYFTLKPSLLISYVRYAPIQANFAVLLDYRNSFWSGLSYRTGDAVCITLGVQVDKLAPEFKHKIRIGYAFDWTTSRIPKFNNGTHEIMVQYDFKVKDKVHIPKFMPLWN